MKHIALLGRVFPFPDKLSGAMNYLRYLGVFVASPEVLEQDLILVRTVNILRQINLKLIDW